MRSFGHKPGKNPIISFHWLKDKFVIDKYNIDDLKVDQIGHITASGIANFEIKGISLNNKKILEVSFGGVPGVSGGPILYRGSGELLGMMSFKQENPNIQFGIHVNEIIPRLK